jgi:hypothetical protein
MSGSTSDRVLCLSLPQSIMEMFPKASWSHRPAVSDDRGIICARSVEELWSFLRE